MNPTVLLVRLPLPILVTFTAFAMAGSSSASVIFSPGLSAGVSWPQSGALEKFWEPGPTLAVDSTLITGRRFDLGLSLGYSRFEFECSSVRGYGTHGASLITMTTWSPPKVQRIGVQIRIGVGGFWTTDVYEPTEMLVEDGSSRLRTRPPVEEIHGWGPSLGWGVSILVLENSAASLSAAALYDRTWASDGYLDTLALVGIFAPSVETMPDN